jgi:hypothetical protein
LTASIKVDVATQAQEEPRDLQPAAPEVVLAVEPVVKIQDGDDNVKNGHYFLKVSLVKLCLFVWS